MSLLQGQFTAYPFSTGSNGVIKPASICEVTATQFIFRDTADVERKVDLTLLSTTAFRAEGNGFIAEGKAVDENTSLLVGYVHRMGDSLCDAFTAPANPQGSPTLAPGRYRISRCRLPRNPEPPDPSGVLADGAELIIKPVTLGGEKKWLVVAATHSGLPLLWTVDEGSSEINQEADNHPPVELYLKPIPHQPSGANFSVAGHIYWPSEDDDGQGSGDTDSFTAVHTGPPPIYPAG
jgi:hypothetical protein